MNFLKLKALIVSAILFAASSAFASFEYRVTLDTSSLAGSTDYLYLQYTPVSAVASHANVYSLTTDGTLGAQSLNVVNGSAVTGTLPGTVTLANTNAVNDYNHAITVGNTLSFLVNFDSYTPSAGFGSSTFSVGLFSDELGTTPALNVNGGQYAGTVLTIDLNNNGTTVATSLDAAAQAAPTPIPAAAWLLGSGLMGLVGVRRRKQN